MNKINKEGLYTFLHRAISFSNLFYIIKKPLMLCRFARVAFYYAVLKKNIPWNANLALTSKCNLNCEHCFAHTFKLKANKDNLKELSKEELIGIIKECLALGICDFDLQGGETLLHPDIEEIIKAAEPHRSFINIVTNGTLFNENWAIRLKRLGVDGVSFSLDSYFSEEHDSFRNQQGAFYKTINAVKIAQKHRFHITILTTVTHQSLYSEGVKLLNRYCIENDITNYLLIGIPVGKWLGRADILITDQDHDYMEELAKKTKKKIHRDLSPHFFRSGCPAVKEGFYLTPYGDVLPCPFIHISLGNIRDHYLNDILKRALTIKEFNQYYPKCLIGQDKGFINKYGRESLLTRESPLDGERIFQFKTKLPYRKRRLTC